MIYELKDCRTGAAETERKTTVEISEKNGEITFVFTAENCKYYCPFKGYNKIHSCGDACEVLIGSDPNRKVYYEIELNPHNDLMIAKMTYLKETKKRVLLNIGFEKVPFVKTEVLLRDGGYVATMKFPKEKIMTGEGEVYFNAYRLDTDGGKSRKDKQLLYALNPTMRPKFHVPSYFLSLKDAVNIK